MKIFSVMEEVANRMHEIDIARVEAYSVENREAHASFGELEYIGAETKTFSTCVKTFVYYKDPEGRYWYKSVLQEGKEKSGEQNINSRKAG